MPIIEIDGVPGRVEVDASFLQLAPEAQAAQIEEIKASSRPAAPTSPPRASGGGLGAADQAIAGIGDIGRGFSATGRQTGLSSEAAPAAAPDTGPNAISEVVEGVRSGDWSRAGRNFGPAVARVAPDIMGGLAAAGTGAMLGGPIGAVAGGALYAAGRSFGDNVEQRARNNQSIGPDGNLAPTTSDSIGGGIATAGEALLGGVGSAGLATTRRALSSAAPAAGRGFTARTGAAVADAGLEAGTEMAGDAFSQAATSVGTTSGLSVDPVQAAVGGALAGSARGAASVPTAAARGGLETAARIGGENAMGDLTPDRAASVARVNAAVERRAATTDIDAPMEHHLNGLRTDIEGSLHTVLLRGRDAGWYDPETYRDLRSLFENASRHNKTLAEGEADSSDVNPYGLSQLDDINAPEAFKATVRDLLVDLDTLSVASRKKNLAGGFEKFGDLAGRAAAVGGGFALGGPMGAAAGVAASLVANPLHARVGAAIGRRMDTAFGTRAPAVALAQSKALRILEQSGRGPVGDTYQTLKQANDALSDADLSERYQMGLPVDPASVSRGTAQMIQRRLTKGLDVDEALIGKLTDSDKAGVLGWLREQAEVDAKKAEDASATEASRFQRENEARQAALDAEKEAAWGKPPTSPDPERGWTAFEREQQRAEAAKAALAEKVPGVAEESIDAQAAKVAKEYGAFTSDQAKTRSALEKAREAMAKAEDREVEKQAAEKRAREGATARQVEASYAQVEAQRRAEAKAAMQADKASAKNVPAVPSEVDAYLNGGLLPDGADNTDAVTRSQIAEWEQSLARANRLSEAQGKPAKPPKPGPTPEEEAERAAAKGLRSERASELHSARVGLLQAQTAAAQAPATAPAPTLAPTPVEAPVAPPVAAPVAPPAAVSPSPAEPPATSDYAKRALPGWAAGVRRFVVGKGVRSPSRAEIMQAVDDLEEGGHIASDLAEAVRTSDGSIGKRTQQMITARVGELLDAPDLHERPDVTYTMAPPQSGPGPIRDMARWESARDARQSYLTNAIAETRGVDEGMATLLGSFQLLTDDKLSPAHKVEMAKAVIAAAPDAASKARREAVLKPLIAMYQK